MPPPAGPARPLRRTLGAVGAAALLVGLVVGLPAALIAFAGNPLPGHVPTVDGLWTTLTSPDDGSLFLTVLTLLGWLAWASFAVSVLLEAYARLTRRPTPTLPGLRWQQRIAAGLVAAVAAVTVSTGVASAEAALVDPRPVTVTVAPTPGAAPAAAPVATPAEVVHVVRRGEGLLDLQDRYGVPWRRIAEANYGLVQPDGGALERGQSRVYAGWRLRIPIPRTGASDNAGFGPAVERDRPPVETERVAAPDQPPVYEVAEGDWMWHIAERYLGDPERYPEIAALNPEHAGRHGDYPDHIEAGWTLRLPPGAADRGPLPHATGTATPVPAVDPGPGAEPPRAPEVDTAPAPTPPGPELDTPPETAAAPEVGTAPEVDTASETAAAPAGVAGLGSAADGSSAASDDAGPDDDAGDAALDRFTPTAFAAAGLLAAMVLAAAADQWRRRHPYHRPGLRFTSPAARRLERSLRRARQPHDSERLTAALRALAAGLAGREADLPDVVGALVDEGAIHLLLAVPCPAPPTPWEDHGDRWTLVAEAALAGAEGPLSPLPTLTAVGSQAGIHLLLDLERMGVLHLRGDPARSRDLLRYLAVELACNAWSDQVEVLVAGFDPAEADLLVTVDPDRVRATHSVSEAARLLRRRVASARATLRHTGAGDAFAGRVRGLAGDAWMPQVLLVADPSPEDLDALAELDRDLTDVHRCAVAVVTTGAPRSAPDGRTATVTPDGAVHLRLPWVRAALSAASLSMAELSDLATGMREARTAPPRPVPPAVEPESWAAGTDAAGALIRSPGADPAAADDSDLGEIDESLGASIGGAHVFFPVEAGDGPAGPPAAAPPEPDDPHLDVDLAAWYADDPGRPRIGVLGPVLVNAPGVPPETRRRLHAEIIVFLAQRGSRGADAGLLISSLWPDVQLTDAALQRALGRARRWLGTSTAGAPWLSDVDETLVYRLAEGYLFDWHLFRRLRARAETKGDLGEPDLRAALELVRGRPLDDADRTRTPGTRNPYPWLADSEIHPPHLVATVVDTAHDLAERCLARGDLDGARWAVRQAWYADVERSYDHPWRDLLRTEHAAGRTAEQRGLLAELMRSRDAEVPEDLAPDTYRLIRDWPVLARR